MFNQRCMCKHRYDEHDVVSETPPFCSECDCTGWQMSPLETLHAIEDETYFREGEEPPDDDPTWVDLAYDPTTAHMSGVTNHKHMRFYMPYISQIDGTLWQGGVESGMVLPEQFKHLISLYRWERYTVKHELDSFVEITMYDSLDQAVEEIDGIADWVLACSELGPTLVHCQAGLNRSAVVMARVLMKKHGCTGARAIEWLRDNRSPAVLCNQAFEDWLRSFDG